MIHEKRKIVLNQLFRIVVFAFGVSLCRKAVSDGMDDSAAPGQFGISFVLFLFGSGPIAYAILSGRIWERWIELQHRKLEKKYGKKRYRKMRNAPFPKDEIPDYITGHHVDTNHND